MVGMSGGLRVLGDRKVGRGLRPPCGSDARWRASVIPPSQPIATYTKGGLCLTPPAAGVPCVRRRSVRRRGLPGDERRAGLLEQLSGRSDTLQCGKCGRPVAVGGGSSVAYELSVTLTDEEYAELAAEAARSGKPVEELVHDIVAHRVKSNPPPSTPSYPMTSRTVMEQQYREGKVLGLPTREPLTGPEAVEREHRAQLLKGGTPAAEMVIEDRGPR